MIDKNDPRLTAYALGELEGDELAAFESLLLDDPGAWSEIEAIRAMSNDVSGVLARSGPVGLDPDRRRAVYEAAGGRNGKMRFVAVAAAVLLALTIPVAVSVSLVLHSESADVSGSRAELNAVWEKVRADGRGAGSYATSRDRDYYHEAARVARSNWTAAPRVESKPPAFAAKVPQGVKFMSKGSPVLHPERPRNGRGFDDVGGAGAEAYDRIRENGFRRTTEHDTSTFSIDVDTASYSNVRRFLTQQYRLPPKDAVRIEELINYFDYDYAGPGDDDIHPFLDQVEVASCPWSPGHRLLRVGIQGKKLAVESRPASNLVFLVDVSGSMQAPNKLPLVKQSLRMLTNRLDERDHIAVVVYARSAGVVLPSTSGDQKRGIFAAIDNLAAGGSTNGGAGIELAYRIATDNFIEGGVNRVVLATDGDWNVGVTDRAALLQMIKDKAKTGVYLSVLGFGTGNYKDATMETLSNSGNGNYAYIDTLSEARKVLVEQLTSTLVTIAKDVKIQIFFNPRLVAGYRLIGYENRLLAKQDFNDDTKDAGEIGAGHAVTALYELVPAGDAVPGNDVDPNPFVTNAKRGNLTDLDALCLLRLRYKRPDESESRLLEQYVFDSPARFDDASRDFRFAACVAMFGMLLRDSQHKGTITWDTVLEIASSCVDHDRSGRRAELVELVRAAKLLDRRR